MAITKSRDNSLAYNSMLMICGDQYFLFFTYSECVDFEVADVSEPFLSAFTKTLHIFIVYIQAKAIPPYGISLMSEGAKTKGLLTRKP